MITSTITLEQMLDAREKRARAQSDMLSENGMPLVCFTMNMPGPVKRTPLSDFAFNAGLEALLQRIEPQKLSVIHAATGSEAMLCADIEKNALKAAAMALEEAKPVGRLYDMDVLTAEGKLERSTARRCLVCGGTAAACARSRAHGLNEVLKRVDSLLRDFAVETLGQLACDALMAEVAATPKPGLVDAVSCGAHTDMTFDTFIKSANALHGYFCDAARTGMDTADQTPQAAMARLKPRGIMAEGEMLNATGGVNTHKGMIYSLGILLCAMGRSLITGEAYMAAAQSIAANDANERLAAAKCTPVTHGDAVYAKTGARGARGEAAAGFPGGAKAAKRLAHYAARGFNENDACVLALAEIIANTEDTNLLHRGGAEGLEYARREAKRVCALPEAERVAAMARLDAEFTARSLSPGGCADILALGIFLNKAEKLMCE